MKLKGNLTAQNITTRKDITVLGTGAFGSVVELHKGPFIVVAGGGANNTATTLIGSQTVNRTLTLPDATDTLVGKSTTDTLINKTVVDASDTVTASALFSAGTNSVTAPNTINVRLAANPTVGQVLTATSATAATWQTPSSGGGEGALGYAMFYGNAPGDYSSTIAVGAAIDFPHAGPTGGITSITRSGAGNFVLPTIGTYDISFMVSITEAGQLELSTSHLGLITYSTTGRATGTSLITNRVFLTTTVVNDVLSVLNPPGNSTALTVTPIAGGTHAAATTLCIVRLA